MRDWEEEMPYRISYIDASMLTDKQIKERILQSEEFATEPAALARARELFEDVDCKTVLVSDNSDEHLTVVGLPLNAGLTARISPRTSQPVVPATHTAGGCLIGAALSPLRSEHRRSKAMFRTST